MDDGYWSLGNRGEALELRKVVQGRRTSRREWGMPCHHWWVIASQHCSYEDCSQRCQADVGRDMLVARGLVGARTLWTDVMSSIAFVDFLRRQRVMVMLQRVTTVG